MIAKKNSRYDLEGKRIVLFNVGLLTAGAFTLAAFTYSEPIAYEREKQEVASTQVDFVLEIEQPETPKTEQAQQQVATPQTNQSSGDPNTLSQNVVATTSTSTSVSTSVSTGAPTGIDRPSFNKPIIDVGQIDPWPAEDAKYMGGTPKMYEYVQSNLVYPQIDREIGNQGKVFVSFIVEKDGSVTDVKIERGVSKTIDREAKRIVASFPKWEPGENDRGQVVRTRVRLPISFILE